MLFFYLQTCYEMERYLKDEPKVQTYKKLDNMFPAPRSTGWKVEVDPLCISADGDDAGDHHLDSLSTSPASSACSGLSWDSPLSCAVLVKQEPVDDEDDFEDSYDRLRGETEPVDKQFHLKIIPRNSCNGQSILPTLTPPSSPESGPGHSNGSSSVGELDTSTMATRGQGIVRVTPTGSSLLYSILNYYCRTKFFAQILQTPYGESLHQNVVPDVGICYQTIDTEVFALYQVITCSQNTSLHTSIHYSVQMN